MSPVPSLRRSRSNRNSEDNVKDYIDDDISNIENDIIIDEPECKISHDPRDAHG